MNLTVQNKLPADFDILALESLKENTRFLLDISKAYSQNPERKLNTGEYLVSISHQTGKTIAVACILADPHSSQSYPIAQAYIYVSPKYRTDGLEDILKDQVTKIASSSFRSILIQAKPNQIMKLNLDLNMQATEHYSERIS